VNRRTFVTGLGAVLTAPLAVGAQQAKRMPAVGMLIIATREQTGHFVTAFEDGMRALGYVDGRNIVYTHRFADGNRDRVPELAAEMVKLKLDVIVTGSAQQTIVAQKATREVPIVMTMTNQPVALGLVASLARPGGNITGLSADVSPEIAGKRIELLKEAAPHLRRIGALRDPAFPWSEEHRHAEEAAARKFGMSFERIDVQSAEDFQRVFESVVARRIDGLTIYGAALFFGNRAALTALVAKSGRPAVYGAREFVEAGGFLSYGVTVTELCRRAATYVDKILQGAKPGDLPVEQPTQFELVINLKTAKALGLTIPQSLLLRADQVIE
jgi:ABC-type uncharacterized transport system substrate-binding protein